MSDRNEIQIFESRRVRTHWEAKLEKRYFAIVDIIAILTDSKNPGAYWRKLKERLKMEGNETVTNCHTLKMRAADGKMRQTDVADVEQMLRLVQSVPSPKAEPVKLWLARVGHERLQDMSDPARSVDRAREYWQEHGRSEKWIQQRMMGQETRNKLTDYWKNHDINDESEYAILTNIIHKEWSGVTVQKHKQIKGLRTQNLRDHMSEAELIFTALAELSTRQFAEGIDATGMKENADAGKKGGGVAKRARKDLEDRTGKKVVSTENFLPPAQNRKTVEKKGRK